MSEHKPNAIEQIKSYPPSFWIANTMEIFERLSWYGFYSVMALYVTGAVDTGGLGFSTEDKGTLFAIVPFFLYFFPIFTGALADRFGYRRMFIIAYVVMVVSYAALGQFSSFWGFFGAFAFVAVGAAIFKPVVVGTVARVTTDSNSGLAFGVFYMMVNIGGFLGPIVAGIVRGEGWEWVFYACSFWATINLLIALFIYKDPPPVEDHSEPGEEKPTFLQNTVEVLGNIRFFITVGSVLVFMMLTKAIKGISWETCGYVCLSWLAFNIIFDSTLSKEKPTRPTPKSRLRFKQPWFKQRMFCSNWRFAVFLLLMSGFWTSFNQIFITIPEYIRDFTETRPMLELFEDGAEVLGFETSDDPDSGLAAKMATVNVAERYRVVRYVNELGLQQAEGIDIPDKEFERVAEALLLSKLRVSPDDLEEQVEAENWSGFEAPKAPDTGNEAPGKDGEEPELPPEHPIVKGVVDRLINEHRQVNPEYIGNINAGSIVLFQIVVALFMSRFRRFTTMIVGMIIAGVGVGLPALAGANGYLGTGASIGIVCLGIFLFSFGEMMASPTSQDYVGSIAPADKKALYMGYYFLSMALGKLFGGILSGELYGSLARDQGKPELMWAFFGMLMFITAGLFVIYNKYALPKPSSDEAKKTS